MKSLLYMMGKNILPLSLILLLIASLTLVSVPRVRAQPATIISLIPLNVEVPAPGQSFMINVTVIDVANLTGWEFKLWYNTTILDATRVYKTWLTEDNTDWVPWYPVPGVFDPTIGINDTLGRVWYSAVIPILTPFTGSGPLLTINFTATAVGSCGLNLNETALYKILYVPPYSEPIDHGVVPGSATVIPEFPASIVTPLLLITTLAATFLGKMVRSRKRKDALTTE